MSQLDSKPRRQRAASAKPSNERKRPSSGHSTKNNLYGGLLGTKRNFKGHPRVSFNFGEESHAVNTTNKGYKQNQQLMEENMVLKKQINTLKKELQLQRGKTQVFRRKNSEHTKNLNVEFEKEIYWTGSNANMVRGIKSQYELIKEKYNQKCKEYDELAKDHIMSSSRQDKAYIEALEHDNKKLIKALAQAVEELKVLEYGTINSVVEETLDKNKRWKFQLKQVNQNLQSQIQLLKIERKALSQSVDHRDKKISFLQRLLIEKDNGQHAARKKLKKLEKDKSQLIDGFTAYKNEKQNLISVLENKVDRIKDTAEKQAERQIMIFRKELQEKDDRITKLQKEIAYLTTLLSYWKPLDEINEMVANKMINNNSLAAEDKEMILEYSIGSTMMKFSNNRHQQNYVHISQDDNKSITQSVIRGSRRGSTNVNNLLAQNKNISDLMTKSINLPKQQEEEPIRTQITADKRYSENSVKCRKIHHDEILGICQTLKYRFIGQNVPIDQVRALFDYQYDQNDVLMTPDEEAWKKDYINMEETQNILLKNKVFGLNQQDAKILARYLVEDSPNDYVYCDPANENLRTVIKSIIRNIIGQYEVFSDLEKVKKKVDILIEKYETNLESALGATAPKGLISKKKLLQLFKGLGIQLSEDVELYLLGKLVVRSENLDHLQYKILFEK